MKMQSFEVRPIGVIHTPFTSSDGTPIQPRKALGIQGEIVLNPMYTDALKDLVRFDRVWLVYWFHMCREPELLVKPYMDTTPRGLFATRSPSRFNPIGISSVRLKSIDENHLFVEDVDVLDGTPLLDIKPYVPEFDCYPEAGAGWLRDKRLSDGGIADDRFEREHN